MSRPTRGPSDSLPVRGYHPCLARLSRRFRLKPNGHWPGPRSLATTDGVSVDVLSSGYLDVSVRRVRRAALWIQAALTLMGRVSPFGDPRINDCSHLPAAYRSVLRPSSPLSAKASTRCPFALDPKRQSVTHRDNPPTRTMTAPAQGPPLPTRFPLRLVLSTSSSQTDRKRHIHDAPPPHPEFPPTRKTGSAQKDPPSAASHILSTMTNNE